MGTSALARRLFHGKIRLFFILIAVLVVSQCCAFPFWTTLSLSHSHRPSTGPPAEFAISANRKGDKSELTRISPIPKVIYGSSSNAFEKETDIDYELVSDGDRNSGKGFIFEKHEMLDKSFTQKGPKHTHDLIEQSRPIDNISDVFYASEAHSKVFGNIQGQVDNMQVLSKGVPSEGIKYMNSGLSSSDLLFTANMSSNGSGMQSVVDMEHKNEKTELLKSTLPILRNKSMMGMLSTRNKLVQPTSITQMNSLLLQTYNSSSYMRPRWSSQRDRELLSAKLDIENAPALSNASGLYAPIFRNVSKFIRSYELMKRKLKVYIYKEGEKPVFHQPKMRGLYASEGWFMKLMEANKNFIMEQYVERYTELIAKKYRFWNRTEGADHFVVACHDWASRITRRVMQNCIRSLCNANIAQGFKIGKDTSLPVTYIHSMMDPVRGIGEKPPLERSILAFFAGGLHGYLREILLKHWQNKAPDMKIFGQMPRDFEGKRTYREYMKSSKYCICARGYEVHSPRIVEAIMFECVPVIISDNYVPPFFEVLKWEEFAVFVQEKDIPQLRYILLSVTEEKYQALQLGVKKVQKHFQWHTSPVKYDLFHMILHSVWYNRVSQIRPR
ncbi:hypothetical protein K1719_000343 [Acacia pycnantha]|nr:hypothetical protein K1719_000343 [Acacia pycnantha]